MPKPLGSNKENLERTRAHLINIATDCFAEHGYAQTSTTMVVKKAESSRGSLYHHFTDKKDLFKAVYDALYQKIADEIKNYPYDGKLPIHDLIEGCIAYLEIFTDHIFVQIILLDAPYVLGADYCRSKDHQTAYKALYEGVKEGQKDPSRAIYIADFLSGALDSFALKIASSSDRKKAYKEYSKSFKELTLKILI